MVRSTSLLLVLVALSATSKETDLSVALEDGLTSAIPGQIVTTTITVSNAGPDNATGATVRDTFPPQLTGCEWTCDGTQGSTCPPKGTGNVDEPVNVPAGESLTFTVECTIDAAVSGTFENTATVDPDAGDVDPNLGDNSATDDIQMTAGIFVPAVTHAAENETVDVDVHLGRAGEPLSSTAFSLDYDEGCLDPDTDDDGVLDVTVHTPADFSVTVLFDPLDDDGEIDVSVAEVSPPIAVLDNAALLSVTFTPICDVAPNAEVDVPMAFSSDPPATFGNDTGQDVLGVQRDGVVRIWPGPRGDCNGNGRRASADIDAVSLEVFDGGGGPHKWFNAKKPPFPGSPVGCDANRSKLIAAADVTCANELLTHPDCGGAGESLTTPWAPPWLEVGLATENEMTWIRARLSSNGHAVGSLAFSLDLDGASPATVDADGDGRPDHLRFPNGVPGLARVAFDAGDADGELDVLLADLRRSPLGEGVLVEIGVPAELTGLRFSAWPSPSFGSVTGADVDGVTTVEGTVLFVDGFESGDTSAWSATVP